MPTSFTTGGIEVEEGRKGAGQGDQQPQARVAGAPHAVGQQAESQPIQGEVQQQEGRGPVPRQAQHRPEPGHHGRMPVGVAAADGFGILVDGVVAHRPGVMQDHVQREQRDDEQQQRAATQRCPCAGRAGFQAFPGRRRAREEGVGFEVHPKLRLGSRQCQRSLGQPGIAGARSPHVCRGPRGRWRAQANPRASPVPSAVPAILARGSPGSEAA